MEGIYDLAVIGAGPAGLTAAIYAARARLKTVVLESFALVSQVSLTEEIENYPGFVEGIKGFELLQNFKRQAERFGAEFVLQEAVAIEKREKIWIIRTSPPGSVKSLAVIVATGASAKKLGIKGEDKFRGKGVSYCATCDGAFFRNKVVCVIGGGDTAVEEALFLTRFASKVKLIHRRQQLRAAKILQERVFSHFQVELVLNSLPQEIVGEGKVSGVKVLNKETRKENIIECEGVFIFVGNVPNTDFVKSLLGCDEGGYIEVDAGMKTSQEGIFACGDCCSKFLRQVVTACGDGAVAAFSVQKYLEDLKGITYN
ncbi:MAG: thioredoxin-disulfide reductase [Candidatus Omnitrophica bacterium]|nr:thioredoxin-disulfide reductase [Candidatus Omnitrophota bacterium]